jgi:hypothetical protein
VLADVACWPEWTASVSRVEMLDDKPLGLGSRVRVHQPKLRPATWCVTNWEPERRFIWTTATPGISLVAGHLLEPCDRGCKVTLDLRFDGWLGGMAGLFMGRLTEQYIGLEAEGLKRESLRQMAASPRD